MSINSDKIVRALMTGRGLRPHELAAIARLTSAEVRAALKELQGADLLNPPGVQQLYSLCQAGGEYAQRIGPEPASPFRQSELF